MRFFYIICLTFLYAPMTLAENPECTERDTSIKVYCETLEEGVKTKDFNEAETFAGLGLNQMAQACYDASEQYQELIDFNSSMAGYCYDQMAKNGCKTGEAHTEKNPCSCLQANKVLRRLYKKTKTVSDARSQVQNSCRGMNAGEAAGVVGV